MNTHHHLRRLWVAIAAPFTLWLATFVVWHSPRLAVAALEAMRRGRNV